MIFDWIMNIEWRECRIKRVNERRKKTRKMCMRKKQIMHTFANKEYQQVSSSKYAEQI